MLLDNLLSTSLAVTSISLTTDNYIRHLPVEAFRLQNRGGKGLKGVAAVGVGTIIGFILDSWFGTKPWLIIIFFFLGAAAGMLNVIKTANRMQKED